MGLKIKQIKSKKRVKDFGEVYTQEREINAMLDLVKEESYRMDSLFLEPTCGNGNFLVEILKRKLSVRSSKEEVVKALRSIYAIDVLEDNVLESKKRLYDLVKEYLTEEEAFLIMDQNIVCGDALELLESEVYKQMKFDVIIGNPPYQLDNGGGSDIPLYHKFIQEAINLNPKYISMIIPSRWLIGGKSELKKFREEMLRDTRIKNFVDFKNSQDCFSGVNIEGGVCYFLWDKQYNGKCEIISHQGNDIVEFSKRYLLENGMDTFIRDSISVEIYKKVFSQYADSFSSLVSSQTPFGLLTNFNNYSKDYFDGAATLYRRNERVFVSPDYILKNKQWLNEHKILISKAYGMGKSIPYQVINKPFYAAPNECCTQTYLVITPFESKESALNAISYMETKFFRFMVSLKKISQDNGPDTFSLVPIQDFSKTWTDEELYKKYGLTQDEINYIESTIRPMK